MPPEAEQAPDVQDTPAENTAAPEEGNAAPESTEDSRPAVDYQQRYESLVPEYTKGQQLIAAARGDHGPEAQVQALQKLGVDVQQAEEEAEDDPFADPAEALRKELAEIKQQLTSKDEAEQQKQFQELERNYIDKTIDDLQGKQSIKLSAKEKRFVENDALNNRLEDGRPDLENAVQNLIELRNEARDGYIASKKAPKAPVGAAGEAKIDFSNPEARRDYLAEQVESLDLGAEQS